VKDNLIVCNKLIKKIEVEAMAYRYMILGGDKRSYYLKSILQNDNNIVYDFIYNPNFHEAASCLGKIDFLILPIPCTRDGEYITNTNLRFCDILPLVGNAGVFLGCKERINFDFDAYKVYDLGESETFKRKNAILTVEGVLALTIKNTLSSIHGSVILVAGYGRVGSYLVKQLKSLGAKVYVVERDASKTSKLKGVYVAKSVDELPGDVNFDLIYNTVNENILDKYSYTTIFDLANVLCGYNIVSTKSLPAIYSAYSSAKIVAECIYSFIK
jgi:hypothetical protein